MHSFLFLLSYLLLSCQLFEVLLEPLVICRMHRFSLWYKLLLQVDLLLDPLAIVRFDISQIVILALRQTCEVARVICSGASLEGACCSVLCLSTVVSSSGIRWIIWIGWNRFGSGVKSVGLSLSCLRALA